ncbi:MAG: tetratricopeptide repeat protein, partial [Treponema sp.]|nr:tetratricopeptide repeat protein [Treponema sp.]
KIYKQLLQKDKNNKNLKISVAYVTAMSGNLKEASGLYEKLVKDNPTDSSILKNYIAVLMALDRYKEAEVQFNSLKENFPDDESITSIQVKIADGLKL